MKNNYSDEIMKLKELLHNANHAVFFGGAGVSTESGIPDFRGDGGMYNSSQIDNPEYMLSRTCLEEEPEKFFKFFRTQMAYKNAKPNSAHLALAQLEAKGLIKSVITQNIDGLHQKAGSKKVIELHGTTKRCYCDVCGEVFDSDIIWNSNNFPICEACDGLIRPDIVLYEECLDDEKWINAVKEIKEADLLIVGGSSLVVNPAASLISAFSGKHLVIVNYSPTPYDSHADIIIRESIGKVLNSIL